MIPMLLACTGAPDAGPAEAIVQLPQTDGCDNLNPLACLLPWPSDRWLVEDTAMETGWRVVLDGAAIPAGAGGVTFDPTPFAHLDGFGPNTPLLTMFERPVDLEWVAGPDTIERSLEDDSPTVLVDGTGERIAHWVELDARAQSEGETILIVHPARPLRPGYGHAMAFRDLVDLDGVPLAPPAAVSALAARYHTDVPDLEARWDLFQLVFDVLEDHGVGRSEVQMAWFFVTASETVLRQDLLTMRTDALARVGSAGIGCTVLTVEDGYGADTPVESFRRVTGTFTVPSYVEAAGLRRGTDGLPTWVEDVEVPFVAIVPSSVGDLPHRAPVVTFGPDPGADIATTLADEGVRALAEALGVVLVGVDLGVLGDPAALGSVAADATLLPAMVDHVEQAMIAQMALGRTLPGACASSAAFQVDGQGLLDSSRSFYAGAGVLGGTTLTLSPEIDRGVLFAPGASLDFLMERGAAFTSFDRAFAQAYPDRVDRRVVLALMQMSWDSVDPGTWLPAAVEGVDGIGAKALLGLAARNDAQLPNLGADIAMRGAGVPLLRGTVLEPWGFDFGRAESGYLTVDYGDPPVPAGNEASATDGGGHAALLDSETTVLMTRSFLIDGEIDVPCDGICDPE